MSLYIFSAIMCVDKKLSIILNFMEGGDTVKSVKFNGGCNGNTQGVAALVKGMKVDEAISRLKGIDCGGRGTSCPDQLAKALEQMKTQNA